MQILPLGKEENNTNPILKPKIKSIKLCETCPPLPSFYTFNLCEVSRVNYARRRERSLEERCSSSNAAACTAVGIGVRRARSPTETPSPCYAVVVISAAYPFPELR